MDKSTTTLAVLASVAWLAACSGGADKAHAGATQVNPTASAAGGAGEHVWKGQTAALGKARGVAAELQGGARHEQAAAD